VADDPFDVAGPRSCEARDQKDWVYWLMQENYLWNDQVPELDPTTLDSNADVVRAVRADLDRWSRVTPKSKSDALFEEGKFLGLGYKTVRDEDDQLVISFVYPGSPADEAGMHRGDVLETVNGFSVDELDDLSAWSDVTGPSEPGVPVKVGFASGAESQEAILLKSWIEIVTVPVTRVVDTPNGPVGYLLFLTFVEPSNAELDAAFAQFEQAGVKKVVVDVRYNTGGLLAVAKRMASLMAGAAHEGEVAYAVEYNSDLSSEDKVYRLDTLDSSIDVDHVVFVTTSRTLSSSELVINMMRPYTEVDIVGETTGGKPVGMHGYDFCEQVIFPISFRLINADGVSDYFDGLAPTCEAPDDLSHALGEPAEASFGAAIALMNGGDCPGDLDGGDIGEGLTPRARSVDPSWDLWDEGSLERVINSW
jgi:C-terminal processing protease CtpA/Prc